MTGRVLVAGVGNIFLGDDAWGVQVARKLLEEELPQNVHVEDYGIRGVHLAYEILNGYEVVILIDAAPREEEPGTVYVMEIDARATAATSNEFGEPGGGVMDAHRMDPATVVALVSSLGGEIGRLLLVGCEPASTEEGADLTEPVRAAVGHGVMAVRKLLDEDRDGDMGGANDSSVMERIEDLDAVR
jgi:hydrogenase maturation protease